MKKLAKIAGLILVAVFFVFGVAQCSVQLEGWVMKEQTENRREAYEESETHIEGKVETLTRLRREYVDSRGDPAMRGALRQEVLNEASTIDMNKVRTRNEDLADWVESVRKKEFEQSPLESERE